MTYIVAKDPTVRERLIREHREYEENLLKPIDYSDPQVQKNMAEFRARIKPCGTPDTTDLDRLDDKINMSTQEFLEDIWNNQGIAPIEIPEDRHHRVRQFRPYIGCPDCPRWNGRKCTKQFEDTTLCEEITERYKEKGE